MYLSFLDYFVPEDTVVIANNHAMGMTGPKWGPNPTEYDPTHFLAPATDGTGLVYRKPENYFPFSLGKRSCMGFKMVENLAANLVANLTRNFRMSVEPGKLEKIPMGILALPPNPLRLYLRKELFRQSKSYYPICKTFIPLSESILIGKLSFTLKWSQSTSKLREIEIWPIFLIFHQCQVYHEISKRNPICQSFFPLESPSEIRLMYLLLQAGNRSLLFSTKVLVYAHHVIM